MQKLSRRIFRPLLVVFLVELMNVGENQASFRILQIFVNVHWLHLLGLHWVLILHQFHFVVASIIALRVGRRILVLLLLYHA